MTRDKLKDTQNLDEVKKIALNLFDENKILQEQIQSLQNRLFGRKSKKIPEVSEQLDYIPAKVRVIRNIRYKYACKSCEGVEDEGPTVSIARMPDQIIPKSIATPRLLAHILTAKFTDALPFYRQEKQFARIGIELARSEGSFLKFSLHPAFNTSDKTLTFSPINPRLLEP